MKGIQDLIRPCATLARYEAALAAGTITQDVMVFIADVRQIRWKGEIYDCSVTAVTEDGKTFIHADGFNSENDEYYYLPSSAPGDDPAHTFAMLSDLQGAGGVSEELIVDNENVAAAALNNLNERLEAVKKTMAELRAYADGLNDNIGSLMTVLEDYDVIIATALNDLNTRIKSI